MKRFSQVIPFWMTVVALTAACGASLFGQQTNPSAGEQATTATRPSISSAETQPADNDPAISSQVLVYMGNMPAVTQANVDRMLRRVAPDRFEDLKDKVVFQLIKGRVWDLYLKEHPGFVTDQEVEKAVQNVVKKLHLKTVDKLADRLMERSGTTMEEYRQRMRRKLVVGKIIEKVMEKIDEETVKKVFQANPEHFNATLVAARQIVKFIPPYKTPQQREAIRREMEKIRQDLVSGERTWEECLKESDWGRRKGGKLGSFPRHRGVPEPVAKAAFALDEGQFSDVIETDLGFHILQVLDHKPGNEGLEKGTTRWQVRAWLQKKALIEAQDEILEKYPIVGVQAPQMPQHMVDKLTAGDTPTTEPAASQPESTAQSTTTKPTE